MKPYTIMLVIVDKVSLNEWVEFALRLLPPDGQILLRGLITVEPEKSLSEGALPAREWRETFRQIALDYEAVQDEVEVFVDYQPFQRVFEAIQQHPVDLVLLEWHAFDDQVGQHSAEEVLQSIPCNVILVSGIQDIHTSHSVLLALRGGPNLSLGIQVARALAGDQPITLFHAIDRGQAAQDLEAVMRAEPQVIRTVTAVTQIVKGIVRESRDHDLIVMGAGLRWSTAKNSPSTNLFQQVYQQTGKPLILVRTAQQETLDFHPPRFFVPPSETLSARVDRWFAENTFHSHEFEDVQSLMALKEKQGVTISVALPALNEAATIENVIRTIKTPLMDQIPLIDEIVLVDSDSTDNTVALAQGCGIPTYVHQQILTEEVGTYPGKGEALWKSLYVTKGDLIVWVDTDITNIHPRFVYGLLGPLLRQPRIQFVKGFYARPIEVGGKLQAYGGGRVTELVARPLFNLFYPELSGIIQPLSGEYAGRRSALETVPFFSGYGVETGLLIDLLVRFGLEAIAQSDLEVRIHYNQPLTSLSKMAFAILQVFVARLESRYGVALLHQANRSMKLVVQEPERFALEIAEIGDQERMPMVSIPAYRQRYDLPIPK